MRPEIRSHVPAGWQIDWVERTLPGLRWYRMIAPYVILSMLLLSVYSINRSRSAKTTDRKTIKITRVCWSVALAFTLSALVIWIGDAYIVARAHFSNVQSWMSIHETTTKDIFTNPGVWDALRDTAPHLIGLIVLHISSCIVVPMGQQYLFNDIV